MCNMPGEMIPEFTHARRALRCRAMAQAIVQRGFETVVVFAWKIGCPVNYDARHALTRGGTHDAGLAVVDLKTFSERYRGYMCFKCVRATGKFVRAGKRQVNSVTRVAHAELIC